jgi:hypothetical protein
MNRHHRRIARQRQVQRARHYNTRNLAIEKLGRGCSFSFTDKDAAFMQIHVERTGDLQWACGGDVLRGKWSGGSQRLLQAVEVLL